MRVAGTLPCSFVNGDGARYVVFTQGCVHHCPGCQNPETWDPAGGTEMSAAEIAADVTYTAEGKYTVEGGEL